MNEKRISIINDVEIFAEIADNGQIYIPIKPICQAIGVDHDAQRQRIRRHRKLSSVAVVVTATGTDGKSYDMLTLPLQYLYGWVFSIDTSMVSETARPMVERYQDECYEVLYEHFSGSMRRTIETNKAEIELLQQINSAISDEKDAKSRRKKAEEQLAWLRAERLDDNPTLFDDVDAAQC